MFETIEYEIRGVIPSPPWHHWNRDYFKNSHQLRDTLLNKKHSILYIFQKENPQMLAYLNLDQSDLYFSDSCPGFVMQELARHVPLDDCASLLSTATVSDGYSSSMFAKYLRMIHV